MPVTKFRTTALDRLPVCYQQFFKQWKYGEQAAVHYIPEKGNWKLVDAETGEVKRIQNRPIVLKYPEEFDYGLWGGEAVIQGFVKRHPLRRRVPHFWFPTLIKGVFRSEILDKYLEIIVTRRTQQLVDQHYGFDNYILETPPQDLKSNLGIKLKRKMLLALANQDFLPNNPVKRNELLEKYKNHILPLEEAEWYGLTLPEALEKLEAMQKIPEDKTPLKHKFRNELVEQLKERATEEVIAPPPSSSWTSLNPFKFNKRV